MPDKKDYTGYSFLFTVTVIALLLVVGLVPPFDVLGMHIKSVNILSDVYETQNTEIVPDKEYSDTTFTAESLLATSPAKLDETFSVPTGVSQSWDITSGGFVATSEDADIATALAGAATQVTSPESSPIAADYDNPATLIEDYSAPGKGMDIFYAALQRRPAHRPVRIAVLGDSFIEADIITADLREQLQLLFGGQGVGFVPFASPVAQYRATVKHTFEGWQAYNVLKKKTAPVSVQDKFFVSGYVCIPAEGAWTRIEGTKFRQRADGCTVARILFNSAGESTLQVTVNDTITNAFVPKPSPLVQQINLHGTVGSIKVKVNSPDGFTGYGIVLEDVQGVSVDNFSVRSNSGMALFATNGPVNSQIGRLHGYDLVILQYGLNAMSPDVLNYNTYSAQLVKIINYVRDCFPTSAIMLMSVGDRSTQKAGQYVTMPAVHSMIAAQKKAAEQSGTAFWNTFIGMGGDRSMVRYVENKWASKDYTHIGFPGGRQIATQMVRSIVCGYREYCDKGSGTLPVAPTAASAHTIMVSPPPFPSLPASLPSEQKTTTGPAPFSATVKDSVQ